MHRLLKRDWLIGGGNFGEVRGEVCDVVRWIFRIAVYVRNRAGHHTGTPLGAHHRIQASVAVAVSDPELEFFEAERFPRFGDGAATDAVEDEFAPDFIFCTEFEVFPRSLTS